MTGQPTPTRPPDDEARPHTGRVSFERLRERTDELELIISGMLAFALLTLPGRIFDSWAANVVHVEGVFEHALWFGFSISVGLSYSLGLAFVAHLAVRGYWVGLVGLKSTFPAGIQWERIPLMGPVARAFHRERVSDLGSAIDRADRAASILFAMTILFALAMVWVGLLAIVLILSAGLLGAVLGDTDRIAGIILSVAYAAFIVTGLLPVVLEKRIARRQRAGRSSPGLQRLMHALLRATGVLMPQRLILPVQMTLQSNLHGRGFMLVYIAVLGLAMVMGGMQILNSARFSAIHRYDVLTAEAVDHGMLGAHYEALRSEHDRLLRYPMIPSDRIGEAHLRLFIPHQPQRDNVLARAACTALPGGVNRAEGMRAATLALECLSSFWVVTLDGAPIALDDFVPIERRDLGMRGLVGYIPMGGRTPGRHDLQLVWNPDGGDTGKHRRREYRIPFWFTPSIDQRVAGEAVR